MKVSQSFLIEHPLDVVWDALSDMALVADCLPGAELTELIDERRFKGRMRVRLGPISAGFSGHGEITRDAASHSGTVEGSGVDSGSGSRAKAKMSYRLSATQDGQATKVAVEADIVLSGAMAQFGRSEILGDIAVQLTKEFAANLQVRFNASEDPGSPPAKAGEFNALRLVMQVIWRRLRKAIWPPEQVPPK